MACGTLVIANKVIANKSDSKQKEAKPRDDKQMRMNLLRQRLWGLIKFVSCHNQNDANLKTSYYKKCHSQKVAHHIATLNESDANYVNQTKVIVYCVIAEVMGSHKQSDSKPCD